MREIRVQSLGQVNLLEKVMATHSCWGPSPPPGERIPSCPHPPPLLNVARVTSTKSSPGSFGNSRPNTPYRCPWHQRGPRGLQILRGHGQPTLWVTAPKPAPASSRPAPSRSPDASESFHPLPSAHLGAPSLPSSDTCVLASLCDLWEPSQHSQALGLVPYLTGLL